MVQNLKDLFAKFSDEQACRDFLVQQRWNGSPVCPYCGSGKWYSIENRKRFKCGNSECYKKYSVTVGTVFHATNIPLTTWFPAMYIISAHKKGISSVQLAKDLGVTQKTAWFMNHRIRESLREKNSPLLSGMVEMDETFVGGKISNMNNKKRKALKGQSAGVSGKAPVFGMLERGGKLLLVQVPYATGEVLKPIIRKHLAAGSTMLTDGFGGYRYMDEYTHEAVSHDKGEYVRNNFHTNSIEGFFSQLKRQIYGIHHFVSPKHLQRYCDESAYKYNSRDLKDGDRFCFVLSHLEGRLTYKHLVHGKSS